VYGATTDLTSGSGQNLYTIGTSGQDLRRLTNQPGTDSYPSWTADGAAATDVPSVGLLETTNNIEGRTRLYAPYLMDDVRRVIGSFFAPLRNYAELRNGYAR
jgi:hypothetical protein